MGNKFVNFAQQRRKAKRERAKETPSSSTDTVVPQVEPEPVVLEVKSLEMVTKPQEAVPTSDPFAAGLEAIIEKVNREHDKTSTARFKLGAVIENVGRFATPPSGWSK